MARGEKQTRSRPARSQPDGARSKSGGEGRGKSRQRVALASSETSQRKRSAPMSERAGSQRQGGEGVVRALALSVQARLAAAAAAHRLQDHVQRPSALRGEKRGTGTQRSARASTSRPASRSARTSSGAARRSSPSGTRSVAADLRVGLRARAARRRVRRRGRGREPNRAHPICWIGIADHPVQFGIRLSRACAKPSRPM